MDLPAVHDVRRRIETATPDEAKYSLMAGYLFCARVSEIIGATSPSEIIRKKTEARGPTGKDFRLETFNLGPLKSECAVFTVHTAKRGGKERKIALPLEKEYEPFTKSLVNYFRKYDSDPVFPFTRQKAHSYARRVFEGFKYTVEEYRTYDNGQFEKKVPSHSRQFGTHALRHLRATELIEHYGFDGIDLSIYGGWTLRSTIGVGSSMSRYAHLNWQRYYPKLLKPNSV